MNKNEFLMRLRKALASLPFEECQTAMKYYEEYFAEAGEDSEGDILKELGSPEMLAATILGEYSSAPARVVGSHSSTTATGYTDAAARYGSASGYGEDGEHPQEPWYRRAPLWALILLGILLCPIIFPIIGAVFAMVAAVFLLIISLVGIMASVGISGIAFGISGIVMIVVGSVRIALSPAVGLMTIGIGILLVGIGILVTAVAVWLFAKVAPTAMRSFVALLRRIFKRGGASQ